MKNPPLKVTIMKFLPGAIIVGIFLLGAFLRLYRIQEYMTFLGDEGRDVLIVKRMILDGKFTLLGPITSVGSMYMGPIYYYFMIPFLWIWHFNPVGPSVMVSLFSIATIALLYIVSKEFFHAYVAYVSSFFYAISPLTITYGRSSWNPNIVPFFSLLLIYSLLKVTVKQQYRWFMLVGLCLGILIQLHYVTLLLIPVIISSIILLRAKIPLKMYGGTIVAFLFSYSPFLLFELRHQFVNTAAVWRFIWQQKSESTVPILYSVWNTISDVAVRLFWRLIVIDNAEVTKLYILVLPLLMIMYIYRNRNKPQKVNALKIIVLWIIVGVFSFGIFRGIIYDYYFTSLFAAPFIVTGIAFYVLWKQSLLGRMFAIILFTLLSFYNIVHSPLRSSPNNLLKQTEEISRFVYEQVGGQPYNFALIALRNSDYAYRYFLELWGRTPKVIETPANDPERKTVSGQLFVVCEDKICQPLGHPLWEIAGFGTADIKEQWQFQNVKIFRLIHLDNT